MYNHYQAGYEKKEKVMHLREFEISQPTAAKV
jgi:hypothetical protein